MNDLRSVGFLAALLTGISAASSAEEVKEVAAFQGKGTQLNWIALSADGSKLAAALSNWRIEKDEKVVTIPGEVHIWDVAAGTRLASIKNPKAEFNYVIFSGDGKTLLTVDHGFPDNGYGRPLSPVKVMVNLRAGRNSAYQAWEVATGKAIGPPISPQGYGEFTTAALSPDGKYLATIYNEGIRSENLSPIKPFLVRELTVWDVRSHKASWKLGGVAHKGRVTWADSLAFSPDGGRLALYMSGSGGPTSERATDRPDRPQDSFKSLKMLSLEGAGTAPSVVFEKSGLSPGVLTWPPDGRTLKVQYERAVESLNPANGEGKAKNLPPFIATGARKAAGRLHPLPPPPPNQDDQPENSRYPQEALSADGSRLAVHYARELEDKRLRENQVVFWDVPVPGCWGSSTSPTSPSPPASHRPGPPATSTWPATPPCGLRSPATAGGLPSAT